MPRIKVLATVSLIGLTAGAQAEIDLTDKVRALLHAGYLKALRPL